MIFKNQPGKYFFYASEKQLEMSKEKYSLKNKNLEQINVLINMPFNYCPDNQKIYLTRKCRIGTIVPIFYFYF